MAMQGETLPDNEQDDGDDWEEQRGPALRWLSATYEALTDGQRWTMVLAIAATIAFLAFGLRR
jgi:hypothetical protein